MLRLKDRQRQIPNGYKFRLPELKWSAPGNYPSFTIVCDQLQAVVHANPKLAEKNKWPTTRAGIEDWVDSFNAQLCSLMGWDDYITTDASNSVPKTSPRHLQETLQSLGAAAAKAKELVAGARTLSEWEDSQEPPVPAAQAAQRANTCTLCPRNEPGDFTKWFTVPAAELIRRKLEKLSGRGLSTPHDDSLHICSACWCPLKLKVHVPIGWIGKRLSETTKARLRVGRNCWVLAELGS